MRISTIPRIAGNPPEMGFFHGLHLPAVGLDFLPLVQSVLCVRVSRSRSVSLITRVFGAIGDRRQLVVDTKTREGTADEGPQ